MLRRLSQSSVDISQRSVEQGIQSGCPCFMATSNALPKRPRGPRGRSWREGIRRLSRGPLCCSCLQGETEDLPQEQDTDSCWGWRHPCRDRWGSGENEAIQITVEDLGIDNTSFSLVDEEDHLQPRRSMAHSASSASSRPSALKRIQLKSLSSLPLHHQAKPVIVSTSGDDSDEEEDDPFLFDTNVEAASGGPLIQPAINLIPPTPSDITEDDLFFDINSEESAPQTSGSDGSFAAGDPGHCEEKMERAEAEEPAEGTGQAENAVSAGSAADAEEALCDQFEEEREAEPTKEWDKEKMKARFLRSIYQVAPLPEYTQKNELINRDVSCPDKLKADLSLLLRGTNMYAFTHQQRLINRSPSVENPLTRSATFHALTQTSDHRGENGSPKLRRTTIASYLPQDQNGNFPEKDMDRQVVKPLGKLNTDEVCQWFTNVGLQKCLPHIRDAKLCGADIASVNMNTLDLLHITALEDREQLLSAIYNELHPTTTTSRRLDSLLESLDPHNVETFTSALASMSRSKSSPHVSCLSMNRRSLTLRSNGQNNMTQRNSQLMEIAINASERIVHLRTPKETTMGKIIDSCVKMLGVTGDKSLFVLKETPGSSEELPPDQHIGSLLKSGSENRQLELHLCKTEKLSGAVSQNDPEISGSDQHSNCDKIVQAKQKAKEERIRELTEQVDSLQNAILQVQEFHHDLVAFCSELKKMDGDEFNADRLGSAELTQRLQSVQRRLSDKRQNLQALGDDSNNSAANKNKQLHGQLLEKIKLNCQVFKEEISMVHLNRQLAHLQSALEESHAKEKAQEKRMAIGSLSQLVSLQSPAMLLLVVQENHVSDGRYGFTCLNREGSGLVVVQVDSSHLCVGDRLVEVNGVSVVKSTLEELTDVLQQGPSAEVVVLRQPPPALSSRQHPRLLQPMVNPDPVPTVLPERDGVTVETPSQRKVLAI